MPQQANVSAVGSSPAAAVPETAKNTEPPPAAAARSGGFPSGIPASDPTRMIATAVDAPSGAPSDVPAWQKAALGIFAASDDPVTMPLQPLATPPKRKGRARSR